MIAIISSKNLTEIEFWAKVDQIWMDYRYHRDTVRWTNIDFTLKKYTDSCCALEFDNKEDCLYACLKYGLSVEESVLKA